MGFAIRLNDRFALTTHHVTEEGTDWVLSAELQAIEPATAQMTPENCLC
jgi:hypothetical protein